MANFRVSEISNDALSTTPIRSQLILKGDHAVFKVTRPASGGAVAWKQFGLIAMPTAMLVGLFAAVGCGGGGDDSGPSGLPAAKASQAQVLRGRALVTT